MEADTPVQLNDDIDELKLAKDVSLTFTCVDSIAYELNSERYTFPDLLDHFLSEFVYP